ncbi:MAG: hypothetical protein LBT64_00395 [Puniceicoccales bacterium]|jgi:tyrosine-specific transport protein|nr:hypothetical protein [Puniceicoccales bacterium]
MRREYEFFDSVCLIAGMTIGASVLGLPLSLNASGYGPALVGIAAVYVCMLASGFLLARLFVANHDSDLPTLFRRHLGKIGELLFDVSYFALAFCLLIAYWSALNGIFHGIPCVTVATAAAVYYGLRMRFKFLERINSVFTVGLIVSFALLIFASFRGESLPLFEFSNWKNLPLSLPIILCSFGYHQTVPLVCKSLNYSTKRIAAALIIGTIIPLLFNVSILTVVFRLFSQEELAKAAADGVQAFSLLSGRVGSQLLYHSGQLFSFFAIATSMLGISMTMKGALNDVFSELSALRKCTEMLIILPILPAIFAPNPFLKVLGIAGGIFGTLMAGILPVTPFLRPKLASVPHVLLWLAFVGIFAIECATL